jgi:hypothetical protein
MAWKLIWTEDDAGVADGLATLDGSKRVEASGVVVDGTQVVGSQLAAVGDPSGGTTVDVQCRATVLLILARLRAHGLIAT